MSRRCLARAEPEASTAKFGFAVAHRCRYRTPVSTLLITSPVFLAHETPPGHPERAERLRVLQERFAKADFDALSRAEAPRALLESATLAHGAHYVDRIAAAAPQSGMIALDPDTAMSPGSLDAALSGVGAAMLAVDQVLAGEANNAFCLQRPPGHHAEIGKAMGFCLFNNAAIAARHAQRAHGLERVAILDWDVHHGNGTQDIFWKDPSVLYASSHEMPLYPGTGAMDETGEHDQIVNAPLKAGDDGAIFLEALKAHILPRIRAFNPDLIIISAGFDAHRRDPLANLMLEAADFAAATDLVMDLADRLCSGRIVSVLEGGYDLEGLTQSAAAHVSRLMQA
jgi:acetoin utilization deacetylase AcuC-like enzyme